MYLVMLYIDFQEDQLTSLYETYCQNKPHADDLLADLGEEIDQVRIIHFYSN